jgi:hypothetical protein
MLVKFDSELFQTDENINDISYLITIFSHNYRYEFFAELTEILDSELFHKLSAIDKKIIEEYFNRFVTQTKKEIDYTITLNNEADKNLNFIEAKIFFNQQYLLILENNLNDGYFVDAIIRNFKSKSRKIKRHIDNDWFVYSNGGGCTNIKNTIEATKKRFTNLPKANYKYLKCFVLIDSDKKYPNEPNTKERQKLFDYLDENNIKYHQLYKREIENYLPTNLLKQIENNVEFLEVFDRLGDDLKDFIDLENGIPDKNRNDLQDELALFYASITDEDYNFLRKNSLKIENFKSEFPKLFANSTQVTLKERIAHQINSSEFEDILDQITETL